MTAKCGFEHYVNTETPWCFSLSIFFLTHSILRLPVDIFLRLLLSHCILSSTFYVTCFFHTAFCSLLFFLVCVFNCFHLRLYFYYSSICSLFLLLFSLVNFEWSFLFYYTVSISVYSYLSVPVRQLTILFYLFVFSQCHYSLFLATVSDTVSALWFPILNSLLFLPRFILVFHFNTVDLFADESQVIFICILVTCDKMLFLYYNSYYNYIPVI